jgi:hypothetical protein
MLSPNWDAPVSNSSDHQSHQELQNPLGVRISELSNFNLELLSIYIDSNLG